MPNYWQDIHKPTLLDIFPEDNAMDTLENAQKRAEYWKAEHLEANAEIDRLRDLLRQAMVSNFFESYFRELLTMPDENVLDGESVQAVQARAMERLRAAKSEAALPSGGTVGQCMHPQIERAYQTGEMPPLLPSP